MLLPGVLKYQWVGYLYAIIASLPAVELFVLSLFPLYQTSLLFHTNNIQRGALNQHCSSSPAAKVLFWNGLGRGYGVEERGGMGGGAVMIGPV